MILIVWDTVGDGHDLVYWAGAQRGYGLEWSADLVEARKYPSEDHASIDLGAARETVQRGVQRGRVDVQEIV